MEELQKSETKSQKSEVSNPFEKPIDAIYSIDTSELSVEESVVMMFDDIFPLLAI